MSPAKRIPPELPNLAAPAMRALNGAGITTLPEVAERTEAELRALHGMGPNAIAKLKAALAEHGAALRAR